MKRFAAATFIGFAAVFHGGCSGPQSALSPASADAQPVLLLFWAMSAGGALIWLAVLGLAFYAARRRADRAHRRRVARAVLIGGGVVFPVLVLGVLLAFGLALLSGMDRPGDGLRIHVTGERWWWRVRYERDDLPPVRLANEIRLPQGHRAAFMLDAKEVIHSFWIPPLGGKLDMIPGRTTRITLRGDDLGLYRGVCAEFCGQAHAHMAFAVEVMPPEGFERWLRRQGRPAAAPASAIAARGHEVFTNNGCGGCHAIRGTAAQGAIGPDLTHLGGRHTLGAGRLPMNVPNLARWISDTHTLKPGVRMPPYPLPQAELQALAVYLSELR